MLLEPGPLPPVDYALYDPTPETPGFLDMVNQAWAEIDSVTVTMDALIDPTAVFDDVLTGDTIMSDLDTVDQINGDNAHLANLAPIPNIDGMKANGDAALTAAIQGTPGEAWTPVSGATLYTPVATAPITAQFAGVTLLDLTTNSGTVFNTGDQFQIQVKMSTTTGHESDFYNVHIWGVVTKDGVLQSNYEFNNTDSTGLTTRVAQWGATDNGNWAMTLHAAPATGGELVSQVYQWAVNLPRTASGGTPPPAVTVRLVDWTSGDLNNAHAGDTFQLFITGPANAPVSMWGTYNGAALSEVQIGTTDAAGNFTLADKWQASDAGAWVEYYSVGRFQWLGSLTFTIQP